MEPQIATRRLAPLLDAIVPVLAAAVVLGAAAYHGSEPVRPLPFTLGAAVCLALAARRRAPVWTAAVTGVLGLAVVLLDPAVGPYVLLVPAAALLSLALTGPRWRQVAAGVAAAAVAVAADLVNAEQPGFWSLGHIGLVVAPVLAADVLRTRRSYRSVLLERVELLERTREQEAARRVQEERLRIARDLHDVVAHTLTTINVQAAVAGHLLDDRPEHARQALSVIEEASRDAIAEVRGILGVLRDPAGGPAPLAPPPGLDDVPALVDLARDAGLRARLEVSGTRPDRVPESVSRAAYRIVQESLTNAARHAAGADVRVELGYEPEELAIAVADSGGPGRRRADSGGVGIAGMAERAEALGGSLRAAGSAEGFLVAARLPYRASKA